MRKMTYIKVIYVYNAIQKCPMKFMRKLNKDRYYYSYIRNNLNWMINNFFIKLLVVTPPLSTTHVTITYLVCYS